MKRKKTRFKKICDQNAFSVQELREETLTFSSRRRLLSIYKNIRTINRIDNYIKLNCFRVCYCCTSLTVFLLFFIFISIDYHRIIIIIINVHRAHPPTYFLFLSKSIMSTRFLFPTKQSVTVKVNEKKNRKKICRRSMTSFLSISIKIERKKKS